jgi:hypothetical protein
MDGSQDYAFLADCRLELDLGYLGHRSAFSDLVKLDCWLTASDFLWTYLAPLASMVLPIPALTCN